MGNELDVIICDGIAILKDPQVCSCLEFAFDHPDCDFIVEEIDGDLCRVFAFATSKLYEQNLVELYNREYSNREKFFIMKGMDAREVNSVD